MSANSSLNELPKTLPNNSPQIIYSPKRASLFSSCLTSSFLGCSGCLFPFLLLMVIGVLCSQSFNTPIHRELISGPGDTYSQNDYNKVAIINIKETIMDDEGFINEQINDAEKDPTIKAIVLRMDTPGGSVSTSDYFFHRLTKLRKKSNIPIVVSMGGICASGGYYISMACGTENENVIFAEPTTWAGSIGVIISHYDLSELAARAGIREDSIKSHELKGMGSITKPLTEQERALFQELVNDAFGRFKEVIYQGRKKFAENHEALDKLATGQVFTTKNAIESGLVDKEGYLEDAVKRAMELANLDESQTQVFSYSQFNSLTDLIAVAHAKMQQTPEESIRSMIAPRAYYIWNAEN